MATYLGKLGELTLKGSNIKLFETALKENARSALRARGVRDAVVTLRNGRLYIKTPPDSSVEAVDEALTHLIGLTAWCKCTPCEKNLDAIKESTISVVKTFCDDVGDNNPLYSSPSKLFTFKVKAKREDKSFPLNSYEIEREIGGDILDAFPFWRVDVHNPSVLINIEVRDKCYIYIDLSNSEGAINGARLGSRCDRGLPVGVSGKALLMLSGGLDSPVALWRLLRRGVKVDCVYFESPPYTSDEARQKVKTLSKILSQWAPLLSLNIIPFTKVQINLKEGAPEDWVTMILRIFMVKAANLLSQRCHADFIATGESLSQVASQTIDNLAVTEHFCEKPLLRPLVAMDKEEITKDARHIGTFETSILPYEDCCVLFSPRHPVLHGNLSRAVEIITDLEERYQMDALIKEAFDSREVIHYSWGREIKAANSD